MKRLSTQYFPHVSKKLILALFIVFGFAFSSSASAKTLKEYKENISHLKTDFATIITNNEVGEADKDFENEVFEELTRLLPAEDSVETPSGTIWINNAWLPLKVKDYRNETQNAKRKETILSEVYERLDSIELKLGEFEISQNSARSKDSNKQKIAEILRREQFQKPTDTGESFLQKMWRQIREWINSIFPKPNITPGTNTGFESLTYVLQILLYVVIFAVIAFVVYKFGPLIFERFKKDRRSDGSERIILGEKLATDATSKTLFSEAEKLAGEGDLKGAIRKGYIALLFELSERKHLGLAIHKTNRDYLRDVRSKKDLFNNMNGLTTNYERHWYGLAPVTDKDWEEFRDGYKNAIGIK